MAQQNQVDAIPCDFTKSKSYNFKFQWKIEDFLNNLYENGEWLESKDFGGPSCYSGVQWKVVAQIFPKGQDEDSKDYLSVILKVNLEPPEAANRIFANFSLFIMSNRKKFYLEVKKGTGSSPASWEWELNKFIQLKDLQERHVELLPNGDLTLQFEGKTKVKIDSAFIQASTDQKPTTDPNVVVDIVKKLFLDGTGSDVVIKARDGEFKGHKWVLSLRCEYFRAMFDSGLRESREGVVDFSEDMNVEELKDLMEFLYLGMASNLEKTCKVLLVMAGMLELEELKSLSEDNLIRQLTKDNAMELLVLSCLQKAKNLEKAAKSWVAESSA